MNSFRTKINYLVVFLRFLTSLFFLLLSVMIILSAPNVLEKENYNIGIIIGLPIFTFLMLFFTYRFGKAFLLESCIFIISNEGVIKKNIVLQKSIEIKLQEIKGFSTSNYPTKIWNYKSIIIYLLSGEKIEIPQFLYFNFKNISGELEKNNIKRLGHENFKWKFFDSRYYDFES